MSTYAAERQNGLKLTQSTPKIGFSRRGPSKQQYHFVSKYLKIYMYIQFEFIIPYKMVIYYHDIQSEYTNWKLVSI